MEFISVKLSDKTPEVDELIGFIYWETPPEVDVFKSQEDKRFKYGPPKPIPARGGGGPDPIEFVIKISQWLGPDGVLGITATLSAVFISISQVIGKYLEKNKDASVTIEANDTKLTFQNMKNMPDPKAIISHFYPELALDSPQIALNKYEWEREECIVPEIKHALKNSLFSKRNQILSWNWTVEDIAEEISYQIGAYCGFATWKKYQINHLTINHLEIEQSLQQATISFKIEANIIKPSNGVQTREENVTKPISITCNLINKDCNPSPC